MGTSRYNLPLINGMSSAKVPRDFNNLANGIDEVLDREMSRLNSAISTLPSGSPKGTFATVADLKTAKPNGDNSIYLILSDGKWYFWNGNDWISGGVYQATVIPDRSVTPQKLSFITSSSNLVNPMKATHGFALSSTTGLPTASSAYAVTDFIPVVEGQTYAKGIQDLPMFFYDKSKQFISRIATVSTSVVAPPGAAFMRTRTIIEDLYKVQINIGNTVLPFESYYQVIDSKEGIKVTDTFLSLFEKNPNMFNRFDLTEGFTVNTDGTLLSDAARSTSNFLEIKPDAVYAKSPFALRVAYYDDLKRFIKRVSVNNTDPTFTTVTGAKFARISCYIADATMLMVNEGSDLKPLSDYGYTLKWTKDKPVFLSPELLPAPVIPPAPPGGSSKEPYPVRLSPVIQTANNRYIGWMSDDGKILYGMLSQTVWQSSDYGVTWNALYTLPTGHSVSAVRPLNNGELLVCVRILSTPNQERSYVMRSSGYNPSTPANTAFNKVLDLSQPAVNGSAYIANEWGIYVYNEIVMLAEYGSKPDAVGVYLSRDAGATFTQIYNLANNRVDLQSHMHGVCYDPYFDRLYISQGDAGNKAIKYSDDYGATWKTVSTAYQVTSMWALSSGIVLATDSAENGVMRIPRTTKAEAPKVEMAYAVEGTGVFTVVGEMMYKRPGVGYPLYIAFARNTTGSGYIIGTLDGIHYFEVFKDSATYGYSKGVISAIGPTDNGKVVGTIIDDRQSSYSKFMSTKQDWVEPF